MRKFTEDELDLIQNKILDSLFYSINLLRCRSLELGIKHRLNHNNLKLIAL